MKQGGHPSGRFSKGFAAARRKFCVVRLCSCGGESAEANDDNDDAVARATTELAAAAAAAKCIFVVCYPGEYICVLLWSRMSGNDGLMEFNAIE